MELRCVPRRRALLAGLFAAVLLASCGGGGGGDAGSPGNPLIVPTDVVIADVDGDGRADVLTIALYRTAPPFHDVGHLSVYRQTSPGTFAAPLVYTFEGYPWRLHVADVDGDGLPDVLIGDSEHAQLLWMKQDPSQPGHFESPVTLLSGTRVLDFSVGDLNHDGTPDIAIGECQAQNRALVLYQNPSARGTFQPPTPFNTSGVVCAVAAADVDGDGRDDLVLWQVTGAVTANSVSSGALGIAWQGPDGTLGSVTTLATRQGVNVTRLLAADYTGKGARAPIAYVTPQTSGYSTEVLVAIHDPGSRAFVGLTGVALPGLGANNDAAFGDVDEDGHLDVQIVGFEPTNNLQTKSYGTRLHQTGDGSLQIVATDSFPIAASAVAISDLDGDGRNDIVVYGGNDQVIWMRQSHTNPGQFEAPAALR